MENETKVEETPQEETKQEAPISLIEKADLVASRMEEANKRAEELLAKQEVLTTRALFAGRADAGTPSKTAEETAEEKLQQEVSETLNRYKL